MRVFTYIPVLMFLSSLLLFPSAYAQNQTPQEDRIVIKVIELDYADADHLAAVLAPLLSAKGRIVAYSRTNSLIIRDRASIVKMLVEIIKGPIDP